MTMPAFAKTSEDDAAWAKARGIVEATYGAQVRTTYPDKFYALATVVFNRVRVGERNESVVADGPLIHAHLRIRMAVEESYPDYAWTKFVRDADDAMWDAALAPMLATYPGHVARGVLEARLNEFGYAKDGYDHELETYRTHQNLLLHLTSVFSGQPRVDKRGGTLRIANRAQAHAERDTLAQCPFAPAGVRNAAASHAPLPAVEQSAAVDGYLNNVVVPHINSVIDKHFPA